MIHWLELHAFLSVRSVHILHSYGGNVTPSCACTQHFSKYPFEEITLKIISALHINSLNCCQQNIHSPASLFVLIYIHTERWEMKQWTFVERAGGDALINGSLIPETPFVTVTCSLWLTHWGDTMRRGLRKDGRAENPDKAALLSCQQGVFELSPGEGRRGEFWEAELRVNSICRKTTTATTILPNQVALLKCKASLLQLLTRNPEWLKVKYIICTITLPKLHV